MSVLGRSRTLLIVLVVSTAAGGCDRGEARTTAWAGTIDTLPGGAVEVKNPEQGIWDSASAWRIVEAARIGTSEGEGAASFSQIGGLAVDPAGRIYVLEAEAQEVRVFDSLGTWIRTIGRRGGGPGEFQQAAGMVWDTAGRLWVVDEQNASYSVFDTAGHLVQSLRRSSTPSAIFPWPGIITRDNRLIEWKSAGFDASPQLVHVDPVTMEVRDSFPLPTSPPSYFELRRKSGTSMSMTRVSVPFSSQLTWRLDSNGDLWFGISDQYRIIERRLAGDTLRIIEKAYTPVPVSRAAKDSMLAGLEWFTSQGGELDRSRIPDVQPAFGSFFLDDQGNLWVRPSRPERGDTSRFEVFDPEGRYLGQVSTPFSIMLFSVPVIRDDQVYGITRDSLDVPYVVRGRIEKGLVE